VGANRTAVLGHIDCPVCGFDMQVKHDKNGQASGYCPDCSQQLFTRTDHKSNLLLNRMRVAAVAGATDAPATPAAPAAPKAAPAHEDGAGAANVVKPTQVPAAPTQTPPAVAKQVAGGWWAPILGNSARKGGQQHG
jgi:predicted  nucleic acid-binding Zn-ribbon protein